MEIIECQQNSPEWYEIKRGFVSASRFSEVLNKGTGRGLYMRKLAAERLTGLTEESYHNKAMDAGTTTEQAARLYYEALYELSVREVGFVKRNEDIGCSPDGLIGDEGLIEIKCPLASTHIANIEADKMPTTYIPQVQGQLWVTKRLWVDWVSYSPSVTVRPFYVTRVHRDEPYIVALEIACDRFVKELKELIDRMKGW